MGRNRPEAGSCDCAFSLGHVRTSHTQFSGGLHPPEESYLRDQSTLTGATSHWAGRDNPVVSQSTRLGASAVPIWHQKTQGSWRALVLSQ